LPEALGAMRPPRGKGRDVSDEAGRVVSVEIQGLRYAIRSDLAPDYVQALARYVDRKMQSAADESGSGDQVKIAVLAALNLADEVFRCREGDEAADVAWRERAERLEAIVDRAMGRLSSANET